MAKTPKWKTGLGLEPEDFPKYSKENIGELYDIYKAMRKQFETRKNAFRRKNLVSHAVMRYEREVTREIGREEKHLYNKLAREITLLQKFFNSETSTVVGTREVNRREDLRIFGPMGRSKRKPARTMTAEERERYWDLYDEWLKQKYNGQTTHLVSSQIQWSLADLSTKYSLEDFDLMNILNAVTENLNLENRDFIVEDGEEIPKERVIYEVLAGTRNVEA